MDFLLASLSDFYRAAASKNVRASVSLLVLCCVLWDWLTDLFYTYNRRRALRPPGAGSTSRASPAPVRRGYWVERTMEIQEASMHPPAGLIHTTHTNEYECIGKTATVHHVLARLRRERKDLPFTHVEVNGLTLSTPAQVSTSYRERDGRHVGQAQSIHISP